MKERLEQVSLKIQRPTIYCCEADWKWQPAPLSDFDFWLVLSGHGGLEMQGERQVLTAGSCFLFQPGDAPRCWHDPGDPLVVFACHFDGIDVENVRVGAGLLRAELGELEYARQTAELAVKFYESGGKKLAASLVGQLVAWLLHDIEHGPEQRPSGLEKLVAQIRARPGGDWRIRAMARECAMSVSHFNRRFRQAFGCAPAQFVIWQRVWRAVGLLRESGLSIQQVADALGYSDVFFFHRQFRRVAGITPRAAQQGEISRMERE